MYETEELAKDQKYFQQTVKAVMFSKELARMIYFFANFIRNFIIQEDNSGLCSSNEINLVLTMYKHMKELLLIICNHI